MEVSKVIPSIYLSQTNENPKYIFHGSSRLISTDIEPQKGYDEFRNAINEQTAIYGISIFKGAIPYAVGKGKVSCSIGYREDNLAMKIYDGTIPEESYGYIYVFESKTFQQCDDTCQYVSFEKVTPIDVIQVFYRDFKDCFIDKTKYETIDTPYELSSYMHFNIVYKWMDQSGVFHDRISPEMYTDYSLMSPQEVIDYRCGICLDQVELERDWFEKKGYLCEIFNIQIFRENGAPGHVFLIYYENDRWYWFENAWRDYTGIHSYLTKEALIADVKEKFILQNDIHVEEFNHLIVEPFLKYPYHFSYKQMDEYKASLKKR